MPNGLLARYSACPYDLAKLPCTGSACRADVRPDLSAGIAGARRGSGAYPAVFPRKRVRLRARMWGAWRRYVAGIAR